MEMSLERLEFQAEETEEVIKELQKTADKLESLKAEAIGLAKEKLSAYIKDIERELGFEEQILDEEQESISFVRMRV